MRSSEFSRYHALIHGLWTPNEAFLIKTDKDRQFGQINFVAFGVFSADLSAPILVLRVPWPCFPLINHYFYQKLSLYAKLSTPSTLNIDFIQWHTQLIMCAVKWITHDLIHDFHFTFQAYALPHTLNGICVGLFKFYTWILRQF